MCILLLNAKTNLTRRERFWGECRVYTKVVGWCVVKEARRNSHSIRVCLQWIIYPMVLLNKCLPEPEEVTRGSTFLETLWSWGGGTEKKGALKPYIKLGRCADPLCGLLQKEKIKLNKPYLNCGG